ncbi:hypothetical protein FOCC_FOCC007577 [Frankliniella occidentalis]|nr:hypothetical protein FOCC_FOCC007577 [Frankliniella occidentalis]
MTGGDDGDPLRKLEQSGHVECLLEALGKDLPDSVHHIPWSEPFLFESVHERCTPAVLAEARARGQVAPLVCPTDKMLLPKDEGLRLQVGDPGPGLRLRALEPHHAKAVNDKWSYANPGSERMLAKTIERNSGLSWGVFTEDDPEGNSVVCCTKVAVILIWIRPVQLLLQHPDRPVQMLE